MAGRDGNSHHPAATAGHRHRRSATATGPDEGTRGHVSVCLPPICVRFLSMFLISCLALQLLRESIAEHKPHIDKLLKIGPQLAELSLQEGATVTQRYTEAERRYLAIKEGVKGRATSLDEAVSQSAQVSHRGRQKASTRVNLIHLNYILCMN